MAEWRDIPFPKENRNSPFTESLLEKPVNRFSLSENEKIHLELSALNSRIKYLEDMQIAIINKLELYEMKNNG